MSQQREQQSEATVIAISPDSMGTQDAQATIDLSGSIEGRSQSELNVRGLSSSISPSTPTNTIITTTIATSTTPSATTSSTTVTTLMQPRQMHNVNTDQSHIQILMDALEKLDPDKNGLQSVPKEITSSTLTTRLSGVCKINHLIDHANDLCHSFNEIGSNKYHEHIEKFRDWIFKNKIIEHIFGPNCHVEIIKQSHTILNFVAYSLNNDHVNAIWSASSLKHCGRQVLDLLTSLVRSMRAGPVLHLYWLVKNLNVEEHTEHTLLLTSHILRFIWSHSPCINQIQFCSIQQKDQDFHTKRVSIGSSRQTPHLSSHNSQSHINQCDATLRQQYPFTSPAKRRSLHHRYQQAHQQQIKQDILQSHPSHLIQYHRDQVVNDDDDKSINSKENISHVTRTRTTITNSASTSSTAGDNGYASLMSQDDLQWYAECISQDKLNAEEQSNSSSKAASDTSDHERDLHQNLIDAIKDVANQRTNTDQPIERRENSPIDEIEHSVSRDGSVDLYDDSIGVRKSAIDNENTFNDKQSSSQQSSSSAFNFKTTERQDDTTTDAEEQEWLLHWRDEGNELIEFASDVSVCCSEDKNMADFDDEGLGFIQDENITSQNDDDEGDNPGNLVKNRTQRSATGTFKESQVLESREVTGSCSTTRYSDGKSSFNQSVEHFRQISNELVAHYLDLKNASKNLTNITSQICADEDLKQLSVFNLSNMSDEGKTLLWDLLQDGRVEHLAPNLHVEVENVLVNLVMSSGDRYIRYKFIEACLENLSTGQSVIISLRLLPRFMSFNTLTRNLSLPAVNETYTIVLWAEREHNMSDNFFKNLVEEYRSKRMVTHTEKSEEASTGQKQDDMNCDANRVQIFSHLDAVITRMSFLTFIYSKPFSPVSMGVNRDQMDQLWDCLASDDNLRCSDVLFQWIYQQAIGEDFHGVDEELLDYVLRFKLPTLPPENFRLRGLKLLEQLLWLRQDNECCHELDHPATRLLWDIALKAIDDEVSMAAIRILNHFYIYTNHRRPIACRQKTNFMRYCMEHLQNSLTAIKDSSGHIETKQSLDVMQKVILLIRTHLEVFKAHWSYFLRILQLNSEADLTSHRLNAYDIKLTLTIRLVCQAASSMAKTTIEVPANDFLGELRAEIVKWWYSQVDRSYYEQTSELSPASSVGSQSNSADNDDNKCDETIPCRKPDDQSLDSFSKFLLDNHHSLRLLSHNQELPFDWDERQINELDFKDMQVIYVLGEVKSSNVDPAEDLESNRSDNDSYTHTTNFPTINSIPSIVLLTQENFELLMETDKYLGSFRGDNQEIANRSKTLSRRLWEIIQILPTSAKYKLDLKRCGSGGLEDDEWTLRVSTCAHLMNAECPQRLLYSLQIIDILRSSHDDSNWASTFIRKGGLKHLYEVFMSQNLLPSNNHDWDEWLQECLAYLLKLLFQFGSKTMNPPAINGCQIASSSNHPGRQTPIASQNPRVLPSGSIKRMKRNRYRILGTAEERIQIPSFSDELLALLESTDLIFDKLIRILESSAFCRNQNDQYFYVTMSSRAMIVHHVMSFLSSWCKSDSKFPTFQIQDYDALLKALILDDTDISSRREACNGFFKLHYAWTTKVMDISIDSNISTSSSDSSMCEATTISNNPIEPSPINGHNSTSNMKFSADLLACLVRFLPMAESMKPPKSIRTCLTESEYIKGLNSPGCKDYFWLTCRLIDAPNTCRSKIAEGNNQFKREYEQIGNDPDPQLPQDITKSCPVDLHELCKYLVVAIRKRPVFETRDYSVEDDALRGMLLMMVMAIRRDSTFRYTKLAEDFISDLYSYLFAAPTEKCRYLPKCKSGPTRSTAFDLMLGLVEHCPHNYMILISKLLQDQHQAIMKGTHPTDYWPRDDCRSEVGFVGLINLGATCYLATCMQHLFMIPDLRYAILSIKDTKNLKHGDILRELQKIFAFLLESGRKAYYPRNFCKVYTMDNHPLNITEQTDMTEFLTDLITKLEEFSPGLKHIIKSLFSGTLSNNVVSLDCPHISRTTEEFYTLRVQVADMRNLNEALDELTVKDTLEGDNMYTCSSCEKKVRAEKRACIVKLPRILCFNTMRYTFNMATMTKEKVNTHFSFPLKLDMADYLETKLMKRQQSPMESQNCSSSSSRDSFSSDRSTNPSVVGIENESNCQARKSTATKGGQNQDEYLGSNSTDDEASETIYELIGVTVHTGNADGGHYYCFIRDCEDQTTDKPRWYLFNDAEVKPFDDSHIGNECYGGELTTKSYDAINDRFMDFSIEKTNSAYMLFYKRVDYKFRSRSVAIRYLESDTERFFSEAILADKSNTELSVGSIDKANRTNAIDERKSNDVVTSSHDDNTSNMSASEFDFDQLCTMTYSDFVLPRHLANWIWNDNLRFSRDQFIFEHNYFDFIWQICANISRTQMTSPKGVVNVDQREYFLVSEDHIAIETAHLSIMFVLGILVNSRERPNLSNWTELIRKQFSSSRSACDWLIQLIDDEDTWLKQMLQRCPIEIIRQLFQRLCSDLTGTSGKPHKKLRLVK